MSEHVVKFRPLQDDTLRLLMGVYLAENEDPVATYSRLISATVMAGAMFEMMPEQMVDHVTRFMPNAHMVIKEHPEMFGEMKKAN